MGNIIKECPFCGSHFINWVIAETTNAYKGYGQCTVCGARGPELKGKRTIEEIIELWNNRPLEEKRCLNKLVCVDCKRELVIDKTGLPAIEMAEFGPYKIWEADRWKCEGCGMKIIAGFGDKPWLEHYMPGFKEFIQKQKNRNGYIEFY